MTYQNFAPDAHKSWQPFINDNKALLNEIIDFIDLPFTPSSELVLRFMRMPLDNIKIIILGQDPYPAPGVATGRAFEVNGLNSWTEPFRQVSLKNIMRSLFCAYTQNDPYCTYRQVVLSIDNGNFSPLPPNRLFSSWEKQGVLLLNAYLTCKAGMPGSHRDLWRPFTENLLTFISNSNPSAKWFLWGSDAKSFLPYIKSSHTYISRHPMMCSSKYDDDFLKSSCFIDTMQQINWLGNE